MTTSKGTNTYPRALVLESKVWRRPELVSKSMRTEESATEPVALPTRASDMPDA